MIMKNEAWKKYILSVDKISKNLFDDPSIKFTRTITFTTNGIVIGARENTRADIPKDEVEQFKMATAEFKGIYESEYGVKLSDKEASDKALMMLQFFDVLTSDEEQILT